MTIRAVPRLLLRDTRGVTLVLVALAVSALIGFAGLGVETGLWYSIRRYHQSAADAGALSGAMEQAGGQAYSNICNLAKLGVSANGFTFQSFTCPTSNPNCTNPSSGQMCVNNPPSSLSAYAGVSTAVEVILAQQQNTFFASLFLPNVMIDTRAVAGRQTFPTCMLALQQTGKDLDIGGGGNASNLTLTNCSFMSDSNDPSQSIRLNGNVTVQAAAIDTTGGYTISGNSNSVSPAITTGVARVADPYLNQITYTLPGTAIAHCSTGNTAAPLQPGLYDTAGCTGNPAPMNFSSGTTTLCPGVYYLDGEDNQGEALVISGNGTTVKMGAQGGNCPSNGMNGVTFIATCSSPANCKKGGGFVIGGTGNNTPTVTLSAQTNAIPSGCTQPSTSCIPADILFYQDSAHADTSKGNSTLAGGTGVSLNGVVYTPSTMLTLSGNPQFGSCTELIAAAFSIAGTASMSAPSCGALTASTSTIVLLE